MKKSYLPLFALVLIPQYSQASQLELINDGIETLPINGVSANVQKFTLQGTADEETLSYTETMPYRFNTRIDGRFVPVSVRFSFGDMTPQATPVDIIFDFGKPYKVIPYKLKYAGSNKEYLTSTPENPSIKIFLGPDQTVSSTRYGTLTFKDQQETAALEKEGYIPLLVKPLEHGLPEYVAVKVNLQSGRSTTEPATTAASFSENLPIQSSSANAIKSTTELATTETSISGSLPIQSSAATVSKSTQGE